MEVHSNLPDREILRIREQQSVQRDSLPKVSSPEEFRELIARARKELFSANIFLAG